MLDSNPILSVKWQ